jgi:hypothetical protein
VDRPKPKRAPPGSPPRTTRDNSREEKFQVAVLGWVTADEPADDCGQLDALLRTKVHHLRCTAGDDPTLEIITGRGEIIDTGTTTSADGIYLCVEPGERLGVSWRCARAASGSSQQRRTSAYNSGLLADTKIIHTHTHTRSLSLSLSLYFYSSWVRVWECTIKNNRFNWRAPLTNGR